MIRLSRHYKQVLFYLCQHRTTIESHYRKCTGRNKPDVGFREGKLPAETSMPKIARSIFTTPSPMYTSRAVDIFTFRAAHQHFNR
jgi:hypothetical protein